MSTAAVCEPVPVHQQDDHRLQVRKVDEFEAYERGVLLRNRYRKVDNIQVGSYGKVSLALDTVQHQQVAIKSMAKSINGVSAIARHEVSILKRLGRHENICALLDFFETDSYYFLVFEYCANGDLYDYLKKETNHLNPNFKNGSPFIFKQFVKELVNAVQYSHSRNVYHRDIKPENILIDSNGTVKLTDWGLATVCSKCFDPCIGTEKYMAPETFFKKNATTSIKGKKAVSYDSSSADYWSIGITLLYTLFGACPFKLANLSDEKGFKSFVNNPSYLFQVYPNLSNHGFDIIMQLLQLNPIHRSLDNCMGMLLSNENYSKGLTLDQEMDQFINFEGDTQEELNDDEIFGMDEVPIHNDVLNTMLTSEPVIDHDVNDVAYNFDESKAINIESKKSTLNLNLVQQEQSTFNPQEPPSLINSELQFGTSWADLDDEEDWSIASFKVEKLMNSPTWKDSLKAKLNEDVNYFHANRTGDSFGVDWA